MSLSDLLDKAKKHRGLSDLVGEAKRFSWWNPVIMREVIFPADKVLYHGSTDPPPSREPPRMWIGPPGFYVTPDLETAEMYSRVNANRLGGRPRVYRFTAGALQIRRVLQVIREPSHDLVRKAVGAGYDAVQGPLLWGIFVANADPAKVLRGSRDEVLP